MSRPRPFDAGDLAPDLYHCSGCSYCVDAVWPQRGMNHVCATLEHHDRSPAYSGMGYLATARALIEDEVLDPLAVATRAFACTQCGNCEAVCPIGMRPTSANTALRRWLAQSDALPASVQSLRRRIVETGNRYGTGDAPGNVAPPAKGKAGATVLFADCALRQRLGPEYDAMRKLFATAANEDASGDTATCCGAALAALGFEEEADAWRNKVVAERGDSSTLVVAGGDCRKHLAESGSVRVISFVAWLLGEIDAGRIALAPRDGDGALPRVRLLESCQLRGSGDEAAFIRLLRDHGVDVIGDADPHPVPNPHAVCCGAGGGMAQLEPDSAERMARARVADAAIDHAGAASSDTDQALALTLDPVCQAHLQAAAPAGGVTGPASLLLRCFTITARG